VWGLGSKIEGLEIRVPGGAAVPAGGEFVVWAPHAPWPRVGWKWNPPPTARATAIFLKE